MAQELQSNNDTKELDKDDVINLLAEDVPEVKEPVKEPEKEKEEELELVEPNEEEEKEEEPTEEAFIAPPGRKEILKKYPNFFKDFPYMQSAMYREKEFTEIYSSIDDAKNAAEKAENFDRYQQSLASGKTDDVFKDLKTENPEAFQKLVDDYVPSLMRVDKQAGFQVISDVINEALRTMYNQGAANKDDDLITAVGILNKAIFGNNQIAAPRLNNQNQQNPEVEKLKLEREKFAQERLSHAEKELNTKVDNSIKATISVNIDPRGVMSDYVKNVAVEKAQSQLDDLIRQDDRFVKAYDKLWEAAIRDGYSRSSIEKIRSAYISKAKQLLPSVIQKSRNEALKGLGKKADDNREEKRPASTGRSTSSNSTKGPEKSTRGKTTYELLSED